MDFLRSIMSKLFGSHWVALYDYDGEMNIRLVRYTGGRPFAVRMGFGGRRVWLEDDGKLHNGCYVQYWEPYDPSAPAQLPRWSDPR